MEMEYLWLIPFSIFLNSSLYWVQKHYLIKWFCRKFLSDSVQLECDLKAQNKNYGHSNGAVASVSNGQLNEGTKQGSQNERKLVTDGEINGVSME